MGLQDKLKKDGSNLTPWDGSTPGNMPGVDPNSPLHYEYSLNGTPFVQKKPKSSQLDFDGLTPPVYQVPNDTDLKNFAKSQLDLNGKTPPKYTDNLPE